MINLKNLLSILESSQHFETMFKVQKITVWTDHLKLTYPNTKFHCERVLNQSLNLEEYGIPPKGIKDETSVVVDTLCQLPFREEENNYTEEVILNRIT